MQVYNGRQNLTGSSAQLAQHIISRTMCSSVKSHLPVSALCPPAPLPKLLHVSRYAAGRSTRPGPAVSICATANPGSRNSGTPLSSEEDCPFGTRVAPGRVPEFPNSCAQLPRGEGASPAWARAGAWDPSRPSWKEPGRLEANPTPTPPGDERLRGRGLGRGLGRELDPGRGRRLNQ